MKEPLKFEYDPATDVLTVDGVKYAGDLFRSLSFPRTDRLYQFSRRADVVIVRDCGAVDEGIAT